MEINILFKTPLKTIPFIAPGKELLIAKHLGNMKAEGGASRQECFCAVSRSPEHSGGTRMAITCPELEEEMEDSEHHW